MTPEEKKSRDEELTRFKADRQKFRKRLEYLVTDAGLQEAIEKLRVVLSDGCPMCGEEQREVAGISNFSSNILSGSTPAVVVRCVHCGLFTQHCVFKLGLADVPAPSPYVDLAAQAIMDMLFNKPK